ncbi:UNVERIFIED_CONTAM: lipase 2 [Gekko kuhli]
MAEDLELQSWDLQCERNHRAHRTSEMGCQQLVVRRGQPFSLTLHFTGRSYEEGQDKLAFNVETGKCPLRFS